MTGRAVLFDRDGTLVDEPGYLVDPDALRLLPGAAEAVGLARAAGFRTVLVTNQSAIARGLAGADAVAEANRRVGALCGGFDAIYVCPHHPDAVAPARRVRCTCRKPAPGMLLRARDELGLDLSRSFLVGDARTDLGAARAAGAGAVLVLTGKGSAERAAARAEGRDWDHVAPDVLAAVRWAVAGGEDGR